MSRAKNFLLTSAMIATFALNPPALAAKKYSVNMELVKQKVLEEIKWNKPKKSDLAAIIESIRKNGEYKGDGRFNMQYHRGQHMLIGYSDRDSNNSFKVGEKMFFLIKLSKKEYTVTNRLENNAKNTWTIDDYNDVQTRNSLPFIISTYLAEVFN